MATNKQPKKKKMTQKQLQQEFETKLLRAVVTIGYCQMYGIKIPEINAPYIAILAVSGRAEEVISILDKIIQEPQDAINQAYNLQMGLSKGGSDVSKSEE